MEDYGVAKGYLELDISSLESNVKSAVKALEDLERKGALADSELNQMHAQSLKAGNGFKQAEMRSRELTSQITRAEKACELYGAEIQNLHTIIEQAKQKQAGLTETIKKDTAAKEKAEEQEKSLAGACKENAKEIKKAAKEYGENSKEVQELEARQEKLNQTHQKSIAKLRACDNALTQHENELEACGIEIENAGNKITEFQTKLNNTQASIHRMNTELAQTQSLSVQWGKQMQTAGNKLQSAGDLMNGWGNTLSMSVTAPLTAAGAYAVKTAIDFESAFTGVTKTVDGTAEQLGELRQGIIDMSKEIPSSTTEIAAVAEAAGQLGIQTPNILGFTRTMIDLGNSTNLSAEEGAAALAQFANVTGMSQDKFSNLGSVIVDLGNNFATTEADIVAMGSRLVGAGSQVGMTEPQILAFATALSSVGIEAEAGGTAFSTLMSEMQLAVEKGGESLNQFAEVSGMSAEQFQQAFREDAAGAILSFVEGLSTCEERGMSAIKVLDEMELSDVRMRDALLRAAGASGVFSEAVAVGTSAWEENIALTNEAEKRYGTTASQIEISKNRIADSARVIGEQMMPVVADVIENIAELAERFGQLSPEMQQSIIKSLAVAAAMGPVLKVAGTTTKGIGSLAEGFGKLLEKAGKAGALQTAGNAVADMGIKAASSTPALGGVTGILKSLAGPFGVAALAAGAVLTVSAAFGVAKKKAKQADLKKHFGDVKLSAEEVEDVAKRLTTNDWTVRIDAAIDAKEKLEELETGIRDSVEAMNKTEWKVSVGLELTEEEKAGYKQSVTDYVAGVKSYIEQQRYTANLAIDAIFEPGSELNANFKQSSNEFYSALNGELTTLGNELAELVNQAWEDGVLSSEELELIDKKQGEIQKKLDEIAQARYDLEMDSIHADAPKGSLDADSFQELQKELNDRIEERKEAIEENRIEALLEWQVKLNRGAISPEEFEAVKAEADLAAEQQLGELTVDVVNVELREIKGNYEEPIGDSINEFTEQFNQQLKNNSEGGIVDWAPFWDSLTEGYKQGSSTLKGASRENVKELLENMKPQISELETIAQQYKEAGMLVPENINAGLMDYYQLEAMTGNTDHMYELLAAQIAESPELQEAVARAKKSGLEIPEELSAALEENYGSVYDAINGMYKQAVPNDALVEALTVGMQNTGLQISDSFIDALLSQAPRVQAGTVELFTQIQNGTALTAPQVQALMGAFGFGIGEELATAIASKAPDVQVQAINLLSQLNAANTTQREEIIGQLKGLGIECSDSLAQSLLNGTGKVENSANSVSDTVGNTMSGGLKKNTPKVVEAAEKMADETMDSAGKKVSSAKLGPPKIKTPDYSTPMSEFISGAQSTLNNNHLTAYVDVKKGSTSGYPGFALGGIATEPSIFGEAGPEMAIPLSVDKRGRALELYEKTGEILGVTKQEARIRREMMSNFAVAYRMERDSGGDIVFRAPEIDYDLLANKVAEKMAQVMRNVPVQPIIEMKDGDVYLDNERVGRKQAPVISRIISQNT